MRIVSRLAAIGLAMACSGGPRIAPRPNFGGLRSEWRTAQFNPGIERFRLDNGLEVALVPDQQTNLISVDARYGVGAAEDPPEMSGLAHLVEHLTYELRMAPEAPPLGARLSVVSLGHNAYTTHDETHYQSIGLYQDLEVMLSLEAERMEPGCQHIPAAVFERERQVVLREIDQRDTPETRLDQALRVGLYPQGHPYRRAVGGSDVARLAPADVCRFLDDHYAPERAVLVIGGRFDPATARAHIARRFGRIARRPAGPRKPLPALRFPGGVGRIRADVEESSAIVVFPRPQTAAREAVAFDALVRMLANRMSWVSDDHDYLTAFDHGRLGGDRAGGAYFAMSVRDPRDLERAVDLLFRQIDELLGGEADQNLRGVTSSMELALLASMAEFSNRGVQVADYLLYGGDPTLMARDLQLIDQLTVNALDTGALHRDLGSVVLVQPRAGARAATRRAELPDATGTVDVIVTRASVDPAEAERPLPLPVEPTPLDVRELTLDNGLRVLLAPRPERHLIDARLIFDAGTDADPPDRRGLAELSAYLLQHDTEARYRRDDYYQLRWALGLSTDLDVEVDRLHTRFRARGLALHAEWHVWRLHWLLDQGVYDGDTLSRLRAEAGRRSARRNTRTSTLLSQQLGDSTDPLAAALRLGPGDMQGFRRDHYRAGRASLVVVGKFDPVEMERVIRALWGRWPSDPPSRPGAHARRGRPTPPGPTYLHSYDEAAVQPTIALAFRGEPTGTGVGVHLILRAIIESRVESVRERLGATYGMQVFAQGSALVVRGQVGPERAGDALRLLLEELAAVRRGPSPDDFVRARRKMLGVVLGEAADVSSTADRLEVVAAHRLPLDFAARLAREIATATSAEVAAAAASQLAEKRALLLVTGRAASVDAALERAGISGSRPVD